MAQKGESVPDHPLHGSGAEYRLCLDIFVNSAIWTLEQLDWVTSYTDGKTLEVGQKLGTVGPIQVSRLQVVFLEEVCKTISAGRSILGSGKIEKFLVTTVFSFSALITR